MKCGSSKQNVKTIAVGDMRNPIKIWARTLTASNQDVPDFLIGFTIAYNVYSKLITDRGKELFAGSNLGRSDTHTFVIRWISQLDQDINSDYYIEFDDQYYRILTVEDLDERRRFMKLICTIRGVTDLPVNYT